MSTEAKTKKPAAKVAEARAQAVAARAAPRVRREEALAITAGLTEAERDLVADIVDWQLEGLRAPDER